MIKRIVSLLIITGTITSVALAAKLQRGFAIVVDPVSYKEACTDIDNYAKAVENDGLKTYIIVDRWESLIRFAFSFNSCIFKRNALLKELFL